MGRMNRPSPLFQLELNERNLVLKPLYPIIEVPGKLNGTLNELLQAELERVTFRMMVTKDSLAWLCDALSVYTTKLWEDGKVVILGPKWTTGHVAEDCVSSVWDQSTAEDVVNNVDRVIKQMENDRGR